MNGETNNFLDVKQSEMILIAEIRLHTFETGTTKSVDLKMFIFIFQVRLDVLILWVYAPLRAVLFRILLYARNTSARI